MFAVADKRPHFPGSGTSSTGISENRPLLAVRNLGKTYPVEEGRPERGVIQAVEDVNLEVRPGETLGLVGESGSGKTTTARCILRAITPTSGRIEFRQRNGEVVDLANLTERQLRPLRREMQMIFQDPQASLDPRMTVREIVGEPLIVHGLAKKHEIPSRVAAMLQKVGLEPDCLDRFPAAFSTGQRQRIGIARALIIQPSLVVADEPVSTLDVSVQAQVLNLLKDLQKEFRLTYVFVAHNLDVVRHFCDHVAVMYAGRVIEISDTRSLFSNPRHPYTQALLADSIRPELNRSVLAPFSGVGLAPTLGASGCAYYARCRYAIAACKAERPGLETVESGGAVACHVWRTTTARS